MNFGPGISRRWWPRPRLHGTGEPRGGAHCVVDGGADIDEVRFDGITELGYLVINGVQTGYVAIVTGIGLHHGV